MSIKKLIFGLAAVALLFGLSGSVSAQTTDIAALMAEITRLSNLINSLQGGTPSASGACTFTGDLSMDMVGNVAGNPEVVCLQNYLKSTGHFPAGTNSTGYFGPTTKSAVAAWQAANGVTPAAGYFGSISRAAYNSMASGVVTPPPSTTPTLCPNGMTFASNCTLAPGQIAEALCPNGMTLASNCTLAPGGTPPVPILPPGCTSTIGYSPTTGVKCDGTGAQPAPTPTTGGPGTLVAFALSLEGSPADGTDVRIGTSKIDIVKWKIKTSNDEGVLRQFGIKATHRPWLYWSAARLFIDGQLVGEKTGLSSADFQEVTSGSDYRLVFGNLNHALPLNKDVYVVLQVDAVGDTSRAAASSLVVDQATNSVVVADANDNYTVSDGVTTDRLYDFVSANTGTITPSNSTATPGTRWVKVTESGTTPKVTMQVFKVKAEQKDIEINTVTLSASTSGKALTTLITGWDLYEGSCPTDGDTTGCTALAGGTVTAGTPTSGGTIAFSSLHVNIPLGTEKTFTAKALLADEDDFTADATTYASTTVMANTTGFTAVDLPTFNTATISGSNVTGGSVKTILVAPTLSGVSATFTQHPSIEYIGNLTAAFTISASGGSLYIAQDPDVALATTTNGTMYNATTTGLRAVTASTCSSCGDTVAAVGAVANTDYFLIPDGGSRTFTFTGDANNLANGVPTITAGTKNFQITNIYFGTVSTALTGFNFDTTFSGMSELKKNVFLDVADRN
ncbi:MAG: peptidoglycan-binding protein [Candidatus Vogelbacteria bacterium]|nr:peptidoglycan-binding protein [Candidatus Vogelbacteria bacterium]